MPGARRLRDGPGSEMMDLVEQHKADVVCISATPPAAVMHAAVPVQASSWSIPE